MPIAPPQVAHQAVKDELFRSNASDRPSHIAVRRRRRRPSLSGTDIEFDYGAAHRETTIGVYAAI